MATAAGASATGCSTCRITSRSFDGFGHQLESKLSCIAAAALLEDTEYVHTPFQCGQRSCKSPHRYQDSVELLDRFVGFSSEFTIVNANDTILARGHAGPSWFPRPHKLGKICQQRMWNIGYWLGVLHTNRSSICCQSGAVYSADNCFDWLYCHPHWPRNWDGNAMRRRYNAVPKPHLDWLVGAPPSSASSGWGATVVLHFRSNDINRENKLAPEYFIRAINLLRRELTSQSNRWHGRPPLFRLQTDAKPKQLGHVLGNMSDVVVDGEADSSVVLAFHRMVAADYFVMSKSSMSQAAALLRAASADNQSTLFPACWRADRRRHPNWRDFNCQ